jgi:hypothetical protein
MCLLTPESKSLPEKPTGLQLVKKFHAFIWNPKVHYRIHKSPPPVPILRCIHVHNTPNSSKPISFGASFPQILEETSLAPIVRPPFVLDFPVFAKENVLRRSTVLLLLFIWNGHVMKRSLFSNHFQPNLFLDELGHHSRSVHAVYVFILQSWNASRGAGIHISVTCYK